MPGKNKILVVNEWLSPKDKGKRNHADTCQACSKSVQYNSEFRFPDQPVTNKSDMTVYTCT